MAQGRPFVVTIASEKGGVGKTTLAINLAVYLKSLCGDLPVTIVSFDSHFSVDNMFAGGHRSVKTVSSLFNQEDPADSVQSGEYGVQFLTSERQLTPTDDDDFHLRALLAQSRLGGLLIIDTRPVIDYFTKNALSAADLLIVPINDRPALLVAPAILDLFVAMGGNSEDAWLLPTLIDARLKLRQEIGMQEFLTFSARERGYQVLDLCIAKSPKVESLTTSLTSRIFPILTHARGTIVHQQFLQLAEFVLEEERRRPAQSPLMATHPFLPGRLRRLQRTCPVCGLSIQAGDVHYWHDQRSRRRGALHSHCLEKIFGDDALLDWQGQGASLLLCDLDSVGVTGDADEVILRLFAPNAEEVQSRPHSITPGGPVENLLVAVTGCGVGEFFRERLFVDLTIAPLSQLLTDHRYLPFHRLRRMIQHQQTSGICSTAESFLG